MQFNEAFDPIRALQASWKALSRAPLPLLVGGILLFLTEGGGGGCVSIRERIEGRSWSEIRPYVLSLLPFLWICGCFALSVFLFSSWVKVGFASTVETVLKKGQADVGEVFDSRGRFGAMVLSRLLCGIVYLVAASPMVALSIGIAIATHGLERNPRLALVLIPAGLVWVPVYLYVVLGISLADQAVALENAEPVDSLKRSWSLVRGHRWMLLLYLVVGAIFSMLGFCLCCIGVFVTGPLVEIARSESYLALVRGARTDWWIQGDSIPPPPPQGWGAPPPPAPTVPS